MQIVRVERGNFDLYCPISGQPVLDQNQEPNAASLRGCWAEWALDEPIGLCDELKERWQAHLAASGASPGQSLLVSFLEALEEDDWVAFQITVYEQPWRQMWLSTWTVLDLSEQRWA